VKFGSHGETQRETRARESPRQDSGIESSNLSAALLINCRQVMGRKERVVYEQAIEGHP
jgi:hypothetical protein